LENLGPHPLGETQHVDRAMHAGLRCLYGIALVVYRRRGASKVIDLIDFHVQREGHVVTDQFEPFVAQKMLDVCACAAEEIIDADYTRPFA
jgi:hypothetical protein